MAHAQKPDVVFRRNGRVHLNRRGASVQSTIGSRGVPISGSNAEYTMFRGSVKGTGYPLHSPVSPSLPFPCVTVYHHISARLYDRCHSLQQSDSPVLASECTRVFSGVLTTGSPFPLNSIHRMAFVMMRAFLVRQKLKNI